MSNATDPFITELVSYVTEPRYSLVEKCLKLAQTFEYQDLQVAKYVEELNRLGNTLRDSLPDVKNPTYLISLLNEYMFDTLGFIGNNEDYYNPKNNFLNDVIDQRIGIPITLSIIYMEIAKHVGLDLRPIGFPGHFLVKLSEEFILDPFEKGRLLDRDNLQEILDKTFAGKVQFAPNFLDEIDPEKIIVRIIRNLKNAYVQSFNYEMTMHCINLILNIESDAHEEIRDKGILESRLLHHKVAIDFLSRYLDLEPDAEDADFVIELIRTVKEKLVDN